MSFLNKVVNDAIIRSAEQLNRAFRLEQMERMFVRSRRYEAVESLELEEWPEE